MEDWKTHPIYMKFPTKLDENIGLLAKNNRFSDIEKGALLLHSMAVHDELTDSERRYGESVAAGWLSKAGESSAELLQWLEHYGKIRAAVMNGIPTALAESAIGVDEGYSRFSPKSILLKAADTQPGYKCRDCGYISKSSDDDAFEHTKTKLHTKGFDLVKQQ